MDSITQIALGAAISVAVMGGRTSVKRAVIAGGIAGTLPDLDVLISHGDAISNMTMHRAESHAVFYLTLAAPIIGYLFALFFKEREHLYRWVLAMWLTLVTHPILDTMTIYGTQLGLPFTNYPFGVGSIFIADPIYTIPLIIGIVIAFKRKSLRANSIALAFSTFYLGLGVLAQSTVRNVAHEELQSKGLNNYRVLVTPTPFNIVSWRIVAANDSSYGEAFYSFLRPSEEPHFQYHERRADLISQWKGNRYADRMAWFTRDFYAMNADSSFVTLTDLRMGQEPNYTFVFALAEIRGGETLPTDPYSVAIRPELKDLFKRNSTNRR